jgi:hypothetical protein
MSIRPELRAQHVAALAAKGFVVAPSLPLERNLATTIDYTRVASRMLAAKIAFLYVAAPADMVSRERIDTSILVNKLDPFFTAKERTILAQDRAAARTQHLDAIGWSLENLVAFAWIYGSALLTSVGLTMCAGAPLKTLLTLDTPPVTGELGHWLRPRIRRTYEQIAGQEDFFYCWHNAVRSIAFSGAQNPTPLDPKLLVGLIQERRHALTYALSTGTWEETDLST